MKIEGFYRHFQKDQRDLFVKITLTIQPFPIYETSISFTNVNDYGNCKFVAIYVKTGKPED